VSATTTHPGRVAGKTAIVTGGSGELGAATVRLLVEHGARVANFDRVAPAEPWGADAVSDHLLDITDAGQVAEAVASAVEKHGRPEILVNIAGIIGRPAASHETTDDEFDAIFGVNVKGVWQVTKHVVPHMIAARRGSIINFSSIYGITGGKTVPLYHATKGAVRLLSKADAATYGEHGIRVNSLHPGSMNTTMSRSAADRSPLGRDEYYRRLYGSNPLPRQGEPDEIAYGVLYLASDESSFTTGAELVIDGGFTAI
jgi:NAD(P)-dependent dehydrogenase (short-subunit alcohol dehydrogenase family)